LRIAAALTLSVSVWLSAHAASARELKVAFGQEKAPYLWVENGQVKGIEFDIVKAALAAAGDTLTAGILPNRRVTIVLAENDFDMVTGMQMHQAGEAFYSDDYLTYANFAITRKDRAIRLGKLADIFSHSVAIWQNAWEDLNLSIIRPAGPAGLDYTEFPSQYRQTRFFWAGRADINIIDRNIFTWYSRQMAAEIDTTPEVEFHNILPTVRVRAAFRSPRDRDDFNAGLKRLRARGDYEKIFDKYGLTSPNS